MSAHSELGPTLPPRMAVYQLASELERMARLARECSTAGRGVDLGRAMKTLDRMREVLSVEARDV